MESNNELCTVVSKRREAIRLCAPLHVNWTRRLNIPSYRFTTFNGYLGTPHRVRCAETPFVLLFLLAAW